MTDWLEQIIEAAEHQGFEVRQTAEATWLFQKVGHTVVQRRPTNAAEWLRLIADLRTAGLVFPPSE
jgi:hypothetical protein